MNRVPLLVKFVLAMIHPDPDKQLASHWDTQEGARVRNWLRSNDLCTDSWQLTERGRAWVQAICCTPLPEERVITQRVWVVPGRHDVNDDEVGGCA